MPAITDQLSRIAVRFWNKPALIRADGDGFREISYGRFLGSAAAVSADLKEKNCLPGSRIVLLADYSPDWCAAYMGIHAAGCTAVPLDAQYSKTEVHNILRFVEPAAVLTDASHRSLIPAGAYPVMEIGAVYDLLREDIPFAPVDLPHGAPMSIIFTSGTTGDPKGVMLSPENFMSNVAFLQEYPGLISSSDVLLAILPLHHVYGFTCTCLLPLLTGSTVVFPKSISGADIAIAMKETGISFLVGVPQILTLFRKKITDTAAQSSFPVRVLFSTLRGVTRFSRKYLRLNPGRLLFGKVHENFPKLRYMTSGGARLEPEVFRDLYDLGFSIIEAYGLTETSPIACLNAPKMPVPGSVGRPIAQVDVRIDAPEGGRAQGEVCIKGPNVMMGYFNRPDETGRAIVDGWFRTGDLGYVDKKGNLFLTGRKKEIIVLPNGKNIYPEELEKLYACTERIREVCILALGEKGQEKLTAAVYPNLEYFKRIKTSSLFEAIKYDIETTAAGLPSYQRATRIEIMEKELPRTRLGKLKRFRIQEMIENRESAREEAGAREATTDDPFLQFLMKETGVRFVPCPDHNLETDLGLDSLTKLELFAAVTKACGVRITPDQAGDIITVAHLRQRIGDAAPAAANGRFDIAEEMKRPPEIPMKKKVDIGSGIFGGFIRLFGHFIIFFFLKIFMRATVKGLENLPDKGPFIMAGNHVSYFDALMMHGMLPYRVTRRMISMSLPEIFGRFPLSLIRKPGRIIMTGTQDTMLPSIRYSYAALKQGFPMCIFPEGKRSVDGRIDKPKPGAFHLARACRAPVIPIYFKGLGALYSRKHPGFHFARLEAEILPPLPIRDTVEEMMEDWYAALKPCNDREME